MTMIRLFAGLALAATLCAQDTGLDLRAGLMNTQGDARTMTLKAWGTALEAGYTTRPEGYGVAFRPYLGLVKTNGKEGVTGRMNYNLQAMVGGVDLVYAPFPSPAFEVFLGPSMHLWSIERKQALINGELVPAEEPVGERGAKMGFRLGATWHFQPGWHASVSYVQSEWRSTTEHENAVTGGTWETGFNPGRPGYMLMTIGHRF